MADRQEEAPAGAGPTGLKHEYPEPPPGQPRPRKIYRYPVIGGLLRFGSWWLVFFGIYASSAAPCPFCGQPGCPVGVAAAGIMGGFFAAIWTYGKAWSARLKELFRRLSSRSDRHVTGPDRRL
ncbi:MAG: hypothetical protein ABSC45_02965 [Desulfobaccales bacterium]|jgi:hypothetical protein